jgi:hypothetical protein
MRRWSGRRRLRPDDLPRLHHGIAGLPLGRQACGDRRGHPRPAGHAHGVACTVRIVADEVGHPPVPAGYLGCRWPSGGHASGMFARDRLPAAYAPIPHPWVVITERMKLSADTVSIRYE